jgi:hypothetical protein
MSRIFSGGVVGRRPVHWSVNLTNSTCRMTLNLRSSASKNPQGLSRLLQVLLYLLPQSGRYRKGVTKQTRMNKVYSFGSFPSKRASMAEGQKTSRLAMTRMAASLVLCLRQRSHCPTFISDVALVLPL